MYSLFAFFLEFGVKAFDVQGNEHWNFNAESFFFIYNLKILPQCSESIYTPHPSSHWPD